MRRPLVALSLLSSLALVACEDGPTQTFTPAPSDFGDKGNDGNTPGSVDPGSQGFNTQGGTVTKQDICTQTKKAMVWAKMLMAPITPPTSGAQLDLSGGDSWEGLTIDQAEQINCQSTNYGDLFGDGNQDDYWGDNGEVFVEYSVSTRKIDQMTLLPGYLGAIDAKSRDGMHSFHIPIQTQMTKDGAPYTLDWLDPVKFPAEVNEIYDALTATFAPGLPSDNQCTLTGACIPGNFGDVAYMYFPALGSALWVDNRNAPPPTPSIITRIDQSLAKTMPFSLQHTLLKLDAEGPRTVAQTLGTGPHACSLKMGITFGDFLQDCVQVDGDATKNQTELNKLFGNIAHSTERFSFDVQGVDLNFSDRTLPADDIIHDKDRPSADDFATEFSVDQSTLGRIANDRIGNDPTQAKDLHGSGLVYLEYARLVQAALNQYIPQGNQHQLGAPECLTGFGLSTDIDISDPSNIQYPAGCTGFEGFVTASPASGDPQLDRLAIGVNVAKYLNPNMSLGLKPGHPSSTFCLDATGDFSTSYNYCLPPYGAQGDIISTSFARVLDVLGHGNVNSLPIEAQDIRFFWKQYFTAVIKYLEVAGTSSENPDGVHAAYVDPDNIFFDSIGSGQFEIGEYVDRRFASTTQDPVDVTVTMDVKNGIFNDFNFSRDIYRGETAIYTAVLEKPTDGIGQEDTGLLTNVFGSPVLKSGWSDVDPANGYTAYYCATNIDPQNCGGQLPPLNPDGTLQLDDSGVRPRLARYKGAFGSTSFTLGATPIKIAQTYPAIAQAMVTIPLTSNPYDPNSSSLTPLNILVPWSPKQPGIGFPIALTGTLDKFVETAQLDFSGTTISANVDYDVVIDPNTHNPMSDGSIQFLAVETTDFLGEVFLCQDQGSGDLLGVRMYTPVATILDWLGKHPNAYNDCGIIIRYSPYGNYADYISSLTSGVRLGITQGGGYGRVVDVTLFVPGQ